MNKPQILYESNILGTPTKEYYEYCVWLIKNTPKPSVHDLPNLDLIQARKVVKEYRAVNPHCKPKPVITKQLANLPSKEDSPKPKEVSEVEIKQTRKGWNSSMIKLLRKAYPTATRKELKALFPSKSLNAIRQKAFVLKIEREVAGHDIGTISIREYNGERCKSIKTKNGWKQLHRVLWERKHGKIPKDHVLRCKGNNKLNANPSNWILVSNGNWLNKSKYK